MNRESRMAAVRRWLARWLTLLVVSAGCLGALWFVYGNNDGQPAARLQATSLTAAELGELVGTDDYLRADDPARTSRWTDLAQALGIPFADPLRMLTAQLPATVWTPPAAPASQSGPLHSLSNSLSAWAAKSRKIALGWAQYDDVQDTIELIRENPGITVFSPDWLSLWSADGTIRNLVEPQVVHYAHAHQVKVWALFNNQFNSALTHAVLADAAVRRRVIAHVADIAQAQHLDGINVDFENVKGWDEPAFTAFVRELHRALAPRHILLSVDITPDIVFLRDTDAYFHAGLAADCDYLIVMAYDEHWATDQTPGPVADVPWVTTAVRDLLNTGVPADKLILGVPFYARFWHVLTDGSVTSESYAVSAVPAILASHHAQSRWDDTLGVAYARYPKPDGYEEVWYETDETLRRKLNLVNDAGLAGVAVWSLHLSDRHTWNTLVHALRRSIS
ncbi:MAG: glycoside hydrolase [Alicyclobacillaceae bacterium]|nr:glycoside hydrolase [Alicyclobacillaceae bacterium]